MTHAPERRRAAEAFLREAVFRSRAKQAAQTFLAKSDPERGDCGLGQGAAVALDLSAEGVALARELWLEPLADETTTLVHGIMSAWVREQDGLDRKRNHFLKAFRREHGMDRRSYAPALEAEFAAGLDALAREEDEARARAAEHLLEFPR